MAKAKKSVKKYQSGGRIPSAMVDISRYPSLNTAKKDTAKTDTVKVTNKADTVKVNKNDIKPGNLSKSRMPVMKKSGGSKFPDLTGDGKVTQADILKGRGVIKRNGGVNASMSDRMKNPKSASMMRYGGMKKAQFGKSMPPTPPQYGKSISSTPPVPSRRTDRQIPTDRQIRREERQANKLGKLYNPPQQTKKRGGSVKHGKKK